MYDRAKNQTLSLFCFRDKVDLEILQSDWQRTFLPISPGTRFSQAWDLCKNTANNIHLLYRLNAEKTEFYDKFNKP